MNINEFLLGALENVLGKSYKKAKGNYAFHCPFCSHRKPKLEINLDEDSPFFQSWECWVCQEKGKSIRSLLSHLHLSAVEAQQVLQFVQKGTSEQTSYYSKKILRLPDEFVDLHLAPSTSFVANRIKQYLYDRGLTDNDFIKYGIGYCNKGKFVDRIILPSYDVNNCLNYYVGRSLEVDAYCKYMNPECSRDVIIFENLINWNEPLIIVEGMFDAFAVKRNCTCLLGKQVSPSLMKKIIENPVPEIYICLDGDALKSALKHCETFLNMGKKVYLVRPTAKDPSEEGFEEFTKQLQQAKELTFADLIKYKLDI